MLTQRLQSFLEGYLIRSLSGVSSIASADASCLWEFVWRMGWGCGKIGGMKFAFLVHPRDLSDVFKKYPLVYSDIIL